MDVFKEGENNVKSVVQILAYFVFGAMGFTAMLSVQSITSSLYEMNKSLNELNKKMAVVLITQRGQKDMIIDHETRLRAIEKKRD